MANDRLRTLLSLLGVAVGVFSIVAALTLVDALQRTVREGFAAYGGDVLYVERVPLEPDLSEDGVFRWWAYAARPEVSWREYRYLLSRGEASVAGCGAAFSSAAYAAYGPEATGVDGDWRLLVPQALSGGRGFTPRELEEGAAVAMVGAGVDAAVGDALWADGARYRVVGVFERAGMGTVSPVDVDNVRLVPSRAMRSPALRSSILLSGADEGRVRAIMRECRRLGPLQDDNFALNRLSFLLEELTEVLAMVARVGWIVGAFALLVGGFGVANMLYVSVEERKVQIGICRALGARRRVIVLQFLREAVALSFAGGVAGLALVQLSLLAVAAAGETLLPLTVSPRAVTAGLGVSLALGLAFGVSPARAASRLHPVEAMRGN